MPLARMVARKRFLCSISILLCCVERTQKEKLREHKKIQTKKEEAIGEKE